MTTKTATRVRNASFKTLLLLELLLLLQRCSASNDHPINNNNNNNNNNQNSNNFSTQTAFISNQNHPPQVTTRTTTRRKSPPPTTTLFYANTPDDDDHNDVTPKTNDNIDNNDNDNNNIMRAWNCHGRNQRDLVDRMMQAKIVRTDSVRDVLYQVDRQYYAPSPPGGHSQGNNPYIDAPQPIGLGQTISAPHMHAHVLEEMYPFLKASTSSQVKILDVGCGSGYLTAALGRWVAPLQEPTKGQEGPANVGGGVGESNSESKGCSLLAKNKTGLVYGIDIYPHLVDLTRKNMEKQDKDLLDNKIVTLQVSDGWKGLPDASPFDAIHVGAAAAEFPRALLEQLKVGGVLIIPVGPEGGVQNLFRVERLSDGFTHDDFRITELLGVRYVPLVQQSQNRN